MIELFYGVLVFIAGYAAVHSQCEMIQKVMATLFTGWLIYVNAQPYAGFSERVELNIYLDLAQMGFVSLLYLAWTKCIQRRLCWWVSGCFMLMLGLHGLQLLMGFNLYVYYLTCNLLFTAQLMAVVVYSWLAVKNDRGEKKQTWPTTIQKSESPDLKVVSIRRKTI